MKVGSIVECVNNSDLDIIVPKMKTAYTIRWIGEGQYDDGTCDVGICLEEIKNRNGENGLECCYAAARFREVLPPDFLREEIEELISIKEPA